jgi:hypothetical protein
VQFRTDRISRFSGFGCLGGCFVLCVHSWYGGEANGSEQQADTGETEIGHCEDP